MRIDVNKPAILQIAFPVVDVRKAEAWFHEGLGFLPAGGNRVMMSNPVAGQIQGIKGAASTAWWMVGRNRFFQIEMFQFRRPLSRLMPADFRPCDIGYSRIGVHVHNFDLALDNLAILGSEPIGPILGERGNRRACFRNPEGVYVEVMEKDPLPQPPGTELPATPAAMRYATLSTPDFDASVAYISAIADKGPDEFELHTDEHEALWGLAGARCKRAVFICGDVMLEVVEYKDPKGKPWPEGYQICDQGIMNVAFGGGKKVIFDEMLERALAFGARPNRKPLQSPHASVCYVNDSLGFSVELIWMEPGPNKKIFREWGFLALERDQRPLPDNRHAESTVVIDAPLGKVWDVLCDQDNMGSWIGFKEVTVIREGHPNRNGVGSERNMNGKRSRVIEQVIGLDHHREIRYRVTEGAPFHYHRGTIQLRDTDQGTEVTWRIGFRSKLPLLGGVIRNKVQGLLDGMLSNSLKPYIENL